MQHTEITDLINESCVYHSTGFSGNRQLNIFTQFRTNQPVPHTGLSLREWVLCLQFNRILGEPQTEHTQFHTSQPVPHIGDGFSRGWVVDESEGGRDNGASHTRRFCAPPTSFRTRIPANFSAGMCTLIIAI